MKQSLMHILENDDHNDLKIYSDEAFRKYPASLHTEPAEHIPTISTRRYRTAKNTNGWQSGKANTYETQPSYSLNYSASIKSLITKKIKHLAESSPHLKQANNKQKSLQTLFLQNLKENLAPQSVKLPSVARDASPSKLSEVSPASLQRKRKSKISSEAQSPTSGFSPKKSLLNCLTISMKAEEIKIEDDVLDKLEQPPELKDKKQYVVFSKNFNVLVPGRSLHTEQYMLQEFMRKSRELEQSVKDVYKPKQVDSVGGAYM